MGASSVETAAACSDLRKPFRKISRRNLKDYPYQIMANRKYGRNNQTNPYLRQISGKEAEGFRKWNNMDQNMAEDESKRQS
jgi:hypothetical protein